MIPILDTQVVDVNTQVVGVNAQKTKSQAYAYIQNLWDWAVGYELVPSTVFSLKIYKELAYLVKKVIGAELVSSYGPHLHVINDVPLANERWNKYLNSRSAAKASIKKAKQVAKVAPFTLTQPQQKAHVKLCETNVTILENQSALSHLIPGAKTLKLPANIITAYSELTGFITSKNKKAALALLERIEKDGPCPIKDLVNKDNIPQALRILKSNVQLIQACVSLYHHKDMNMRTQVEKNLDTLKTKIDNYLKKRSAL